MTRNMKGGCQLQKNILFPSSGQKLIFLTQFLDPVLLTYIPVISGICWLFSLSYAFGVLPGTDYFLLQSFDKS